MSREFGNTLSGQVIGANNGWLIGATDVSSPDDLFYRYTQMQSWTPIGVFGTGLPTVLNTLGCTYRRESFHVDLFVNFTFQQTIAPTTLMLVANLPVAPTSTVLVSAPAVIITEPNAAYVYGELTVDGSTNRISVQNASTFAANSIYTVIANIKYLTDRP